MKKRFLLLSSVLVLGVTAGALALVGCGETEPEKEKVPTINEKVRYSEKTNPYAELTWQEFKGIEDWGKKMESDPIYYQFEGSYSEAYGGNYDRTFLYMNCYEDGGLHATYGNENYYGYWTNVDKRGNENLVLHIVRYNDKEYNDGIYESVCEVKQDEYYEYASSIIWNQWGTRTVFIYGYHYSPVKSLTVSGGQTKCVVGDAFDTEGLTVTVTRENGKSIAIDQQSFPKSDCRVKFDGFDSAERGEKEITVSYVYSDVKTSYKCNVLGVNAISLKTDEVKKTYHVGDELDTVNLVVLAACDGGENLELKLNRCNFSALDGNTVGEQEITVTLKGTEYSAKYKVNVVGVKSFTVEAENVQKEFFVGDRLNTENLVIKATFEDDATDEIKPERCEYEGFDSSKAVDSQTVTVKFFTGSATYDVKIIAPEYKGNGKYNGTQGEIKLKINTPENCALTFNGKTVDLGYSTMDVGGTTIYSLAKPETGLTDEEWNGLHKQYILNREELTLSMTTVYKIPGDGSDPERAAQEPMPGIGGNTEIRRIVIDEVAGTATISYKYWYAGQTDVFVCRYTIENGVLTFTDLVSAQVGASGSQYGNLYKTWTLGEDFVARKYVPLVEE